MQRRDLRPIEKLIYSRLLFPLRPICEEWDQELGVIVELDQAELAKSLGINRSTVNKWLVSLQLKAWIICNGNPGAKQTVRFLWKEGMPETCWHVPTGSAAKAVAGANSTCRTLEQQPVGTCNKTCSHVSQVSEGIEKRELREEENAQHVGDAEWLRTVVQAKFPRWTLEQLKLQWIQHRNKGKERGKWTPGDREHFLVAWMPRAGEPPSSTGVAIAEPPWWDDFMSECYPNAPTRDFAQVQKLPSCVTLMREGSEWASSRAIAPGGA